VLFWILRIFKYIIIYSTSCNKGAALFKMASVKKAVKSKGQPRNGSDGIRLMAKIFITTIQVNLCCLIPASLGISTKFTWIIVIKNFAINLYHHSHFLATPLISQLFFPLAILTRAAPFLQLGCFWADITSVCNLTCILQGLDNSSLDL